MKKAIVFALLALVMSAAQGQQFEWAKGYGSTQEGCIVKGSVTDNDGNLYILGQFRNDATWNDELLLPIAPYGYGTNTINTIISKISPSGEMLWKKVIHSNNNQHSMAIDICMAEDSLIWCLTRFTLPVNENEYLYYFDTLITANSDYPISTNNIAYYVVNGLVAFNLQGNIEEQHFIQLAYHDINGRLITYDMMSGNSDHNSKNLSNHLIWENGSMKIDRNGNIIFCRPANDFVYILCDTCSSYPLQELSVENGKISAIDILVDNEVIGTISPHNCPGKTNIQLLKFSPHMEDLLSYCYVIEQCDNKIIGLDEMKIETDNDRNVFLLANIGNGGADDNNIVIDTISNLSLLLLKENITKGFIVKYNEQLVPLAIVSLSDSIINRSAISSLVSRFSDIVINHDSNLVFIVGECSRNIFLDTTSCNSLFLVGNNVLESNGCAGGVFFFSLDKDNLIHHSQGAIPSVYGSTNYGTKNLMACNNNRIFLQCIYKGGLYFPNEHVTTPDINSHGLCLTIFDFNGRIIQGIDYSTFSSCNRAGTINLQDSILYISNVLNAQALFGQLDVHPQGNYTYIAKYVDPAFMLPYVYTGPSDVRIVLVDDGEGAFVVYPNPFRSSVKIKVDGGSLLERDGAATATLTDMQGRQEQVRLTPEGSSTYRLDLSTTRTFRQSGNQAIFLTLTTSAGKQHTVRLLQQADLFGD